MGPYPKLAHYMWKMQLNDACNVAYFHSSGYDIIGRLADELTHFLDLFEYFYVIFK